MFGSGVIKSNVGFFNPQSQNTVAGLLSTQIGNMNRTQQTRQGTLNSGSSSDQAGVPPCEYYSIGGEIVPVYPSSHPLLKAQDPPNKVASPSASFDQLCYEYSKQEIRLQNYKKIRNNNASSIAPPFSQNSKIMEMLKNNQYNKINANQPPHPPPLPPVFGPQKPPNVPSNEKSNDPSQAGIGVKFNLFSPTYPSTRSLFGQTAQNVQANMQESGYFGPKTSLDKLRETTASNPVKKMLVTPMTEEENFQPEVSSLNLVKLNNQAVPSTQFQYVNHDIAKQMQTQQMISENIDENIINVQNCEEPLLSLQSSTYKTDRMDLSRDGAVEMFPNEEIGDEIPIQKQQSESSLRGGDTNEVSSLTDSRKNEQVGDSLSSSYPEEEAQDLRRFLQWPRYNPQKFIFFSPVHQKSFSMSAYSLFWPNHPFLFPCYKALLCLILQMNNFFSLTPIEIRHPTQISCILKQQKQHLMKLGEKQMRTQQIEKYKQKIQIFEEIVNYYEAVSGKWEEVIKELNRRIVELGKIQKNYNSLRKIKKQPQYPAFIRASAMENADVVLLGNVPLLALNSRSAEATICVKPKGKSPVRILVSDLADSSPTFEGEYPTDLSFYLWKCHCIITKDLGYEMGDQEYNIHLYLFFRIRFGWKEIVGQFFDRKQQELRVKISQLNIRQREAPLPIAETETGKLQKELDRLQQKTQILRQRFKDWKREQKQIRQQQQKEVSFLSRLLALFSKT